MKYSVIAILFFVLLGCTEENNPQDLAGIWVDEVTASDTLEFLRFDDGSSLMNLKRGREFSNGHDLPKIGAGLYTFSMDGDNSISLHYSFSSDSRRSVYYFQQKGNKLKIGRFFESDNPASILAFKKVK